MPQTPLHSTLLPSPPIPALSSIFASPQGLVSTFIYLGSPSAPSCPITSPLNPHHGCLKAPRLLCHPSRYHQRNLTARTCRHLSPAISHPDLSAAPGHCNRPTRVALGQAVRRGWQGDLKYRCPWLPPCSPTPHPAKTHMISLATQ